MRRIVTIVALCVVCTPLSLVFTGALVQLVQPPVMVPKVVIQEPRRSEAPNDFIFSESQYCRPFIHTTNPQVVRVLYRFTFTERPARTIGCTGVIVGSKSVLTAKHCMELDGGSLVGGTVTTSIGEYFEIETQSPDPAEDIVLLVVDRPLEVKPPPIARQIPMALNLEGYGCVQGPAILPLHRPAISLGQVDQVLFLAGCVCHGDSGGPIFDDDGALVALMVWTDNDGKSGRGVLVQKFMDMASGL